MQTDYFGVISAEAIKTMTLDAEYDDSDHSTLYAVGGLANHDSASDFSFFYSFVDGDGGCGLRHSYSISTMDLGI